jgi:hypothetical protein
LELLSFFGAKAGRTIDFILLGLKMAAVWLKPMRSNIDGLWWSTMAFFKCFMTWGFCEWN